MSSFINNPSTIEDFKQNVEFQMENVKGWISVNDYQSALIKAKCLVDALTKIVAAEESEQKAMHSHTPCDGDCGMNYCDDNGCVERKRILTDPCLPESSNFV